MTQLSGQNSAPNSQPTITTGLTPLSLLDYLSTIVEENPAANLDSGGTSGMYVFGQKLISTELSTGDGFGESVLIDRDLIYVGMPGEDVAAVTPVPTPPDTGGGTGSNASAVDLYDVSHPSWPDTAPARNAMPWVWVSPMSQDDDGSVHTVTREITVTEAGDYVILAIADAEMSLSIDGTVVNDAIGLNTRSSELANFTVGKHLLQFNVTNRVPTTAASRTATAEISGAVVASAYGILPDGSECYCATDGSYLYTSRDGMQWTKCVYHEGTDMSVTDIIYYVDSRIGDPVGMFLAVGSPWGNNNLGVYCITSHDLTKVYAISADNAERSSWVLCAVVNPRTNQRVLAGDFGIIYTSDSIYSNVFHYNSILAETPEWNGEAITALGCNDSGEYIACASGHIATSVDGLLWRIQPQEWSGGSTSENYIYSPHGVVWFNSRWVISDDAGIVVLQRHFSEANGSWVQLHRAYSSNNSCFSIIIAGSKLFASVYDPSGVSSLITSTDGENWYPVENFALSRQASYIGILVANGTGDKIIAFSSTSNQGDIGASLDNGETWSWLADPVGFAVAIYRADNNNGSPIKVWDTRTYKLASTVAVIPAASSGVPQPNQLSADSGNADTPVEPIQINGPLADIGQVAVFHDATGAGAWPVARSRQEVVDPSSINSVFLYDTVKNSKVETLDFIDPAKGRILGVAEQTIDFKTCYDPAYYNMGFTSRVQPTICWGAEQVGKIWWDLSTVAWMDYEQGDFAYRSANWGRLFPGSMIRLFVWVESAVPPSQYLAASTNRVPRDIDDTEYVELSTVDKVTGLMQTRYFFWATDVGTDSPAIRNGLSLNDIARLIESPQTSGIPYAAFVSPSTVGMWNVSDMVVATDVALHISYDVQRNDNLIHSEFQLVQEGSADSALPANIVTKIIDSLCGTDSAGNLVPDPALPESEKYGIGFRPRQGVFKDSKAALRMFVTAANRLFIERPLLAAIPLDSSLYTVEQAPTPHAGNYVSAVPDTVTLGYLETSLFGANARVLVENDAALDGWAIYELTQNNQWVRVAQQSFNTTKFWNIADWYESSAHAALTKFTHVVDLEYQIQSLQLFPGQTIKVKDGGGGKFKIYEVDNTGAVRVVGIQSATIMLSERLWMLQPRHEVRYILNALLEIFEQEKVLNDGFFALVRFALSEQKAVDWVFKTSFITVLHKIRKLAQYATYQKDNQDFVREFINEVKPYRTKIREYLLSYAADETWDGVVTDFDLPGYYDTDFNRFRSVSGEHNKDPELLVLEDNRHWANNHTFSLSTVDIINGGSGYTIPPQVVISGGGGAGASAYAQVSNGKVRRVIVSSGGTGYVTTPTVTLIGLTGSGAKAAARLQNGTVRKISTAIKFDRIGYDSTMIDWAPNTQYAPKTILTYKGVVYKVNAPFTSNAEFDANYMTPVDAATIDNANDRTMGFYQPRPGMIPRDLGQIFAGIEYPGMKLQGPNFNTVGEMSTRNDGLPQLADSEFDEVVISAYRDSALGTRPEDINIQGGAYVDTYSSHAPEELVPGIIFDALDIQVYTRPTAVSSSEHKGADIRVISARGDSENTVFDVKIPDFHSDSLVIYTLQRGYMKQGIDYEYDVSGATVTFAVPPMDSDIVYVYLMSVRGDDCIFSESYSATDATLSIVLPHIDSHIITDSAVMVNGVRIHDYTIVASGADSILQFTDAPLLGAHLHVYLFSAQTTGTQSFSDMHTQFVTATALVDRVVTLENPLQYSAPYSAVIIVEVDNLRLCPADNRYYEGDNNTASFPVPTTGGAIPNTRDVTVYVNGIQKYENTDYSFDWMQMESGMECLGVTLFEIPPTQASVVVSLSTFAEFEVIDNSHVKLSSQIALEPTSEIKITSFSVHDSLGMRTRVFSGSGGQQINSALSDPRRGDEPHTLSDSLDTLSVMNEGLGYSMSDWDFGPFDIQDFVTELTVNTTSAISAYAEAPNTNYAWVTLNGRRLLPNFDFTMPSADVIVLAPTLNIIETDYIVVTTFAPPSDNSIVGYRVFQNMLGEVDYLRISAANTTVLAQPLHLGDTVIHVLDSNALPTPSPELAIPGVVFVNGERITYYTIDHSTHTLGQLRRGTAGTGQTTHPVGTRVVDASQSQRIPETNSATWNNYGVSLVNSITPQAQFLKEKPSFNPG